MSRFREKQTIFMQDTELVICLAADVLRFKFINFKFRLNFMLRASSRHRTSNIRSYDVSMSSPIAVYATAIPVFSYAGT